MGIPPRVLFVCEGNRARSQMAEAMLRHHSCGRFEAYSAGIRPGEEVPQFTTDALREGYYPAEGLRPKHHSQFAEETFDYLIVLCDRVRAEAPELPAAGIRLDWPIEDPADAQARGLSIDEAMREGRRELRKRIVEFMAEALSCVFCGIVAREEEGSILYADELVTAFMDIRPVNEGHALVVPAAHYETADELPEETAGRMLATGARIAGALGSAGVRLEGYDLFVANGEAGGQEVMHVHLHVIPRFRGDGFGFRFPDAYGRIAPREELDALAERVRAELQR